MEGKSRVSSSSLSHCHSRSSPPSPDPDCTQENKDRHRIELTNLFKNISKATIVGFTFAPLTSSIKAHSSEVILWKLSFPS